jgi:glycosyltransferase involved in cell wall biosynthesis
MCVAEQIERFAKQNDWTIELYSECVSQIADVRTPSSQSSGLRGGIFWHRTPRIPGPHLVKYCWWFFANQLSRWRDRKTGRVQSDIVYSPGINCLDADVITVHIVFSAFYERIRKELSLSHAGFRSWPFLIHRRLYYNLIIFLERRIYRDNRVKLIAVSGFVAAQLNQYFKRQDVVIIPNAVDTQKFNPESRAAKRDCARQKLGYSQSDFVLLLIGNDWKKKGLDALLYAASQTGLPDLRILFVGQDDVSR